MCGGVHWGAVGLGNDPARWGSGLGQPGGGRLPAQREPLEANFPLLHRTPSVFRLETGYNKLVNMSESCVGTT